MAYSRTLAAIFMKILITILLFTLTGICLGQKSGHYESFSSAFESIDSVESISINCMHNNEFKTDGCEHLPNDIDRFYNLSVLYISESGIKFLPTSIDGLKRLKEISLSYLPHFSYSTELCKLKGLDSLQYLGLYMARMRTLPACIGQIKSIKSIDLSHNENLDVQQASMTMRQLPKLETLDLSGISTLTVIPKNFNELVNIKVLQLNYLSKKFEYNTSFDRLSALTLKSLSLSNNWLNALPKAITKLKYLEYIDLSENDLEVLPTQLYYLPNLKHIKIQNNSRSLRIVEDGLPQFTKLEIINLGNSKLDGSEAIINLSKLPNLKELDLFGCGIDTIPHEMMNFIALQKLNLERNSKLDFADLFRKLSKLTSLKYLDISDNKLKSLPKEIGLLTSIEHLVIGQNAIASLPEQFFELKNLKVLNIYGNYGSRLSEKEIQKIKERLPGCIITDQWIFRD